MKTGIMTIITVGLLAAGCGSDSGSGSGQAASTAAEEPSSALQGQQQQAAPQPGGTTEPASITLQATLTTADEVPVLTAPSDALGTFTATVDAGRTAINFTLTVSNAVNIQAAHIHLGDPGVAGPILIPLSNAPFTSPLTGTLTEADLNPNAANGISTLSDAIDAIMAGRTYVNVHTTANPAGEIRGQIQPQ